VVCPQGGDREMGDRAVGAYARCQARAYFGNGTSGTSVNGNRLIRTL
jgi:hypothetical protein